MPNSLGFLIVAAMVAVGVWFQVFAWDECRKVGHSRLYCMIAHD